MSLISDLASIKNVEDTLTRNKVAQFAYTQCAYSCNCADGVTEYDISKEQNIPVGTPSVMRVNETVLAKGWRSQASAITRMLMNHFLGRISYNLNKVNDNMSDLLTSLSSYIGCANGLATLDACGRIPYSQLPESAMEFQGMWNANTNTPVLHDGVGDKGDFYIVSVAGSQDLGSGSIQFFVNDRVVYDGAVWSRLSAGDVKSVNSVEPVDGNVTLTPSDIGLGNVDNTADVDKSVKNATCFNCCTYACAKADFRNYTPALADNTTCFNCCTYACAKADFRNYIPDLASNACCATCDAEGYMFGTASRCNASDFRPSTWTPDTVRFANCASCDAEGCAFGTASRYSCECFAPAGAIIDCAVCATCAERDIILTLCRGAGKYVYTSTYFNCLSIPSPIRFSIQECADTGICSAWGTLFIQTEACGRCGWGIVNFDQFDYRIVGLEKCFCTDCYGLLYGNSDPNPPQGTTKWFCDGLAPTRWISGKAGLYKDNWQFIGEGWTSDIQGCRCLAIVNSLTLANSHCLDLCHNLGLYYRCNVRSCYYPIVEIRLHNNVANTGEE